MRIDVISLFPEFMRMAAELGVVGRAQARTLLDVQTWNPRDYAVGGYRRVDDRPFGGGPGMLMQIDPLAAALAAVRAADPAPAPLIYLSPQGRRLDQARVRELATLPRLILLCGRYEGVDERFIEAEVTEEISIGDYVLSGGELPAAVLIDAIGRLQEGALNHPQSAQQDSFEAGLLDCPHYTRPEAWEGAKVPDVLLSGHHEAIRRWRLEQSMRRTLERRPDLLGGRTLAKEEQDVLAAIRGEAPRNRRRK
jgi:tRNA (guanine37-N1)-methyltransferase